MAEARNEFGVALRVWRDRLSPLDAGLPSRRRRRARGLRREELAAMAALSVDYITRLEQGRSTKPSAQVVAALARALQLSSDERDHLFRSAGLLPPQPGHVSAHVPAGVQRLISRLGDIALAVFSADWTLVTWTPLWATLVGDPLQLPLEQRNLVHAVFLQEAAGARPLPESERGLYALEAALVADLRLAAASYPDDQHLHTLIERGRTTSLRFAELWATGAVGAHVSDRKTIKHPLVGDINLDCDVLTVPGADLKVVVYTAAAETPDAEKLDFLRVDAIRTFSHQGQGGS